MVKNKIVSGWSSLGYTVTQSALVTESDMPDHISLLSDDGTSLYCSGLESGSLDDLLLLQVSGLFVANQGSLDVVEGSLDL